LLRARRNGPRRGRAAEERDELAPPHSMTSSARARRVGGTSRPRTSAGQIDARYFDKPYYIVPREQIGQESFAVIRDAMRREGVIGLARVVLSSREREPMSNGLSGITLRFAQEVRGADDYFDEIPEIELPAEMMKLRSTSSGQN
jgi:DNA end-binding protein Ku